MTTTDGVSVPERIVAILDDHVGAVRDTLEAMTQKLHEVIDEVRPTVDHEPEQEGDESQ